MKLITALLGIALFLASEGRAAAVCHPACADCYVCNASNVCVPAPDGVTACGSGNKGTCWGAVCRCYNQSACWDPGASPPACATASPTKCGNQGSQCIDCTGGNPDPCKNYSCSGTTCGAVTNKANGTACNTGGTCQSGACTCSGGCWDKTTTPWTCRTPGNTDTYCGPLGGECVAGGCTGNWHCDPTARTCTVCNGCVQGGACLLGNTAGACGTGGAACHDCGDCLTSPSGCSGGTCTGGTPRNEGGSCWGATGTCHAGICCQGCWDGTTCRAPTTGTCSGSPCYCGKGGGNCDDCTQCKSGTTSCNSGTTCTGGTYAPGGACSQSGKSGICRDNVCCTGCVDGAGHCNNNPGLTSCGNVVLGVACQDCADCETGATCNLASGLCTGGTVADAGIQCISNSQPGTCHGPSCCQGCWDGTTCQTPIAGACPASPGLCPCGTAGGGCEDCNQCRTGASCTGGACAGAKKADGTVCTRSGVSGTCVDGSCCTSGMTCCTAGQCRTAGGTCVNTGASCSTAVDDCGQAPVCQASGQCVATATPPSSACVAALTLTGCQTAWCDYSSTDHCATASRTPGAAATCALDCTGKLTHNAYPGGFAAEDFTILSNVDITSGQLVPRVGTSQVMSRNLSREISEWAGTDEKKWMLSRVHVNFHGTRGAGCGTADTAIFYLMIDEAKDAAGKTYPVPIQLTPTASLSPVTPFVLLPVVQPGGEFSAEQVFDILTWAHKGTRLRWAAEVSRTAGCAMALTSVEVGYQAMLNNGPDAGQTYKLRSYSALVPLANMMYFGALETPGAWTGTPDPTVDPTRDNLSPRGHLVAQIVYDPANPTAQITTNATKWDAGDELNSQNPKDRRIYTMIGGTRAELKTTTSGIQDLVLPSSERGYVYPPGSGVLPYDFTGDGTVTDADANEVINWTRGCRLGTSGTCNTATPSKRPWLLGGIDRSTPAIIGPPNMPWWLNGSGIPVALRAAYWAWAGDTARASRDTIAYIGAQDGMIHAFYAGNYKTGDDSSTTPIERRGFFGVTGAAAHDYGGLTTCRTRHSTESPGYACPERFAYVPSVLLDKLRNNVRGPGQTAWGAYPSNHSRASIEASPLVEDVAHWTGSLWEFKTILYSGVGNLAPFLFAVDVTNPESPQPLWEKTYANFRGTLKSPPSVGFARIPGGEAQVIVTNTGFGWQPLDPYFLVINAWDGNEIVVGGVNATAATPPSWWNGSYGTITSPVLLDMNGDGFIERAYMFDTGKNPTTGKLFTRVVRLAIRPTLGTSSPTNPQVCEIKTFDGEGAFGGIAGYVCDATDPVQPCTNPKVRLYFGTSDDPRWDDPTSGSTSASNPPFHLYAVDDEDPEPGVTGGDLNTNPVCVPSNHSVQFTHTLATTGGAPEKSWITPSLDMEYAYFATLRSPTDSECDFTPDGAMAGALYKIPLESTSGIAKWTQALTVQPVVSVRVYDKHIFLGTSSGTATLASETGTVFNNTPQNLAALSKIYDSYWIEQ